MSIEKKIFTDVIVTFLIRFALQIRGLVLIPLIAYPLGKDIYGAYVQVVVIVTIIANVFGFGLHSSLVHEMQSYSEKSEHSGLYWLIFFLVLGSSLLGAMLVFVSANMLSTYTLNSKAFIEAFKKGSVLVILLSLINLSKNYFRSQMKVKTFSFINGGQQYLTITLIAVTILGFDGGFAEVLTALVLSKLISVVVLHGIIISQIGFSKPAGRILELYKYGISFMMSVLASQFLNDIDKLIVGGILGPAAVGLYTASYRIASAIRVYMSAIRTTFFAEFNRLWAEGEKKRIEGLLKNGMRYFFLFAIPSVAGIYLVGPKLIDIILQHEPTSELSTLLVTISVGVLIYSVFSIYSQVFYAADKGSLLIKISTIGVVANVLLNLFFIPRLGIVGAALTTLISYGTVLTLLNSRLRQLITVNYDFTLITKASIASLSFVAVFELLIDTNIAIIVLTSPVLYFALMFVLGGVKYQEIIYLREQIR